MQFANPNSLCVLDGNADNYCSSTMQISPLLATKSMFSNAASQLAASMDEPQSSGWQLVSILDFSTHVAAQHASAFQQLLMLQQQNCFPHSTTTAPSLSPYNAQQHSSSGSLSSYQQQVSSHNTVPAPSFSRSLLQPSSFPNNLSSDIHFLQAFKSLVPEDVSSIPNANHIQAAAMQQHAMACLLSLYDVLYLFGQKAIDTLCSDLQASRARQAVAQSHSSVPPSPAQSKPYTPNPGRQVTTPAIASLSLICDILIAETHGSSTSPHASHGVATLPEACWNGLLAAPVILAAAGLLEGLLAALNRLQPQEKSTIYSSIARLLIRLSSSFLASCTMLFGQQPPSGVTLLMGFDILQSSKFLAPAERQIVALSAVYSTARLRGLSLPGQVHAQGANKASLTASGQLPALVSCLFDVLLGLEHFVVNDPLANLGAEAVRQKDPEDKTGHQVGGTSNAGQNISPQKFLRNQIDLQLVHRLAAAAVEAASQADTNSRAEAIQLLLEWSLRLQTTYDLLAEEIAADSCLATLVRDRLDHSFLCSIAIMKKMIEAWPPALQPTMTPLTPQTMPTPGVSYLHKKDHTLGSQNSTPRTLNANLADNSKGQQPAPCESDANLASISKGQQPAPRGPDASLAAIANLQELRLTEPDARLAAASSQREPGCTELDASHATGLSCRQPPLSGLSAGLAAVLTLIVCARMHFVRLPVPEYTSLVETLLNLVTAEPAACEAFFSLWPPLHQLEQPDVQGQRTRGNTVASFPQSHNQEHFRAQPPPKTVIVSSVPLWSSLQFLLPISPLIGEHALNPVDCIRNTLPYFLLLLKHPESSVVKQAHTTAAACAAVLARKGSTMTDETAGGMGGTEVKAKLLAKLLPWNRHRVEKEAEAQTPPEKPNPQAAALARHLLISYVERTLQPPLDCDQISDLETGIRSALSSVPVGSPEVSHVARRLALEATRQMAAAEATEVAACLSAPTVSERVSGSLGHTSSCMVATPSSTSSAAAVAASLVRLVLTMLFICDCTSLPAVTYEVGGFIRNIEQPAMRRAVLQHVADLMTGSDDYARKSYIESWFWRLTHPSDAFVLI